MSAWPAKLWHGAADLHRTKNSALPDLQGILAAQQRWRDIRAWDESGELWWEEHDSVYECFMRYAENLERTAQWKGQFRIQAYHPPFGMSLSRDYTIFVLRECFHPGIQGRKSPRPSWIHLAHVSQTLITRMELSSREDCLHDIFRHVSSREDISSRCLRQGWNRPGMKSSRDDGTKSCKQQQENDQIPRWIQPGTKVIPGWKLSCKEALKSQG